MKFQKGVFFKQSWSTQAYAFTENGFLNICFPPSNLGTATFGKTLYAQGVTCLMTPFNFEQILQIVLVFQCWIWTSKYQLSLQSNPQMKK